MSNTVAQNALANWKKKVKEEKEKVHTLSTGMPVIFKRGDMNTLLSLVPTLPPNLQQAFSKMMGLGANVKNEEELKEKVESEGVNVKNIALLYSALKVLMPNLVAWPKFTDEPLNADEVAIEDVTGGEWLEMFNIVKGGEVISNFRKDGQ